MSLKMHALSLIRRGVKTDEDGTTIDLPPQLIEFSRIAYTFSKAEWPGWMFVVQFVVIMAALISSTIAAYSIGNYMAIALAVQANEDGPSSGYSALNQDEEDGTNKRPDERGPTSHVVATTRVRQFFQQAKALTNQSTLRVLLRGARSYALYAFVMGVLFNIADSCFLGTREGVDPTPSIEHENVDLPVDLPGGTFMSFVGIFVASLLAKPFHAVWVFSLLRVSPEVGYFATLRSVPVKRLFVPAVIESAAVATVRAIAYASLKYSMLATANGIVAYDSETAPGAFSSALTKVAFVTLLSALVQFAIHVPASIILWRAEAAALVDQPPQYTLTVGEEPAAPTQTIVKVFRQESVEEILANSRCKSRFGARVKQALPCKVVKNVVVVMLKSFGVQLSLGFVAGLFVFGLTAIVAAFNPDLTW